jgi:hypothetical protein
MRYLFVILFLVACIISGASQASFISYDNPRMTRTERMVKVQVLKHRKTDLKAYNPVRAIDDSIPVIEISSSRTGLPEEFVAIPKKPKGEVYGK